MFEVLIYSTAFLLTYMGVEQFRRWSQRRNVLDVPNERSSHIKPTPRGGGLIIVVISLTAYTILLIVSNELISWGYLIGAVMISLISWLDDLYKIPSVWRFLVHTAAAVVLIFNQGFWNEIHLPIFGIVETGIAGVLVTLLWIVWLTNAYNFMDGIDGIAALQAVTSGIGWCIIGKMIGSDTAAVYAGVLAFSSLGFLIHNWQPARVFMGDVGSAFLGYTFAAFPLIFRSYEPEKSGISPIIPLIALLIVWLFIFDTVYTFVIRLLKKQKVWNAHREHIYQKLIIAGYSHRFVAGMYGLLSALATAIVIFWLKFDGINVILLVPVLVIEVAIIFLFHSNIKNVD